jgi:tetratricopeptide (TPR) repeat protein
MKNLLLGVRGVSLLLVCLLIGPSLLRSQSRRPQSAEMQKYAAQALQALNSNQPAAAAEAFRAVLKIDPRNVDARANLGVVAMMQGDWAGAEEQFRKALKLQPSLWKGQALLGLCELRLGHEAQAAKLLSASFPHLQDPKFRIPFKLRVEVGLQLAEIWRRTGELEKAATLLSQLRELAPTNADALYAAYRVHNDLAFHAIDSLAVVAPGSAQLHRALAEHLVNDGHLEDAIGEYRKALQSAPGSPGVHYELGEALLANSHLEPGLTEAQKEFESALALDPADAKSECMLGKIELWRASSKTAFEHYARARNVSPGLSCANLALARLLEDEGKSQEALSYLETAKHSDPYDPEVRHRLSVLYRNMGRTQEADRELSAFQELEKVHSVLNKALEEAHPSN